MLEIFPPFFPLGKCIIFLANLVSSFTPMTVSYVCECRLVKCGAATHKRLHQCTQSDGEKFQKTTNICKACRNCHNRKERNVLAQHDARGAEGDGAVARRPRLLCFLLARVVRFCSHSVESRAERK